MALPHSAITPIPLDGPDAVPSLWNDRYLQIDDNFEFLQDGLSAAFEDIADLDSRLTSVEVSGSASVSASVKTDWHYRADKTCMELWSTYWTLLDPAETHTVPAGVNSGGNSVNVNTTVGLVLGYEYIISSGITKELVVIAQILGPTQIYLSSPLQHSYSAGAILRRTDFTIDQIEGKATAHDGNLYFCGPLALGSGSLKSCVIKRNADTLSPLLMYFKDDAHSSWTAVLWALKRTMPDGTIEVEHVFPADSGGNIRIKFVCGAATSEDVAEIYGIIFLSEYSGLGGTERTGTILSDIALAKAIADKSVTLAKMADIVTGSIMGRNSSGTGSPEAIPISTVKSMLSLGSAAYTASGAYTPAAHVGSGGTEHANVAAGGAAGFMTGSDKTKLDGVAASANNYAHPNHSGDVTSSGDGAQTIANNAVTLAKMADMATASLLGRDTAGTGDPEVLSAATVKSILGVGTMANRAATISASGPSGGSDGDVWFQYA